MHNGKQILHDPLPLTNLGDVLENGVMKLIEQRQKHHKNDIYTILFFDDKCKEKMRAKPIVDPSKVLDLYEWESGGTNFKPALQ